MRTGRVSMIGPGVGLLIAVLVAACGGAPGASQIGTTFDDPEGKYSIQVDSAWQYSAGGLPQGIEAWILGPAEGDFTPNINLLTQNAPGMDLAKYAEVSLSMAPQLIPDVNIIAQSTLDGPGGQLAQIDYTGTVQGRPLHFLAYFLVKDGEAVVATLTTPQASFDAWRAIVEPYLRTLRPK